MEAGTKGALSRTAAGRGEVINIALYDKLTALYILRYVRLTQMIV